MFTSKFRSFFESITQVVNSKKEEKEMSVVTLVLGVLVLGLMAFATLVVCNAIAFWRVVFQVARCCLNRHGS